MNSIGILIFDGVDIGEVVTPYRVFATAATLHAARHPHDRLFRCFMIAATMRPVHASGGLKILPDCVPIAPAEIDILIVPAGSATLPADHDSVKWLRDCEAASVKRVWSDNATAASRCLALVRQYGGETLALATAQQLGSSADPALEQQQNRSYRDERRSANASLYSAA